jgi:hypothetical protein
MIYLAHHRNSGCALGWGFVDFVHKEEARSAQWQLDGKRIHNRLVTVKAVRGHRAARTNDKMEHVITSRVEEPGFAHVKQAQPVRQQNLKGKSEWWKGAGHARGAGNGGC